MSATVTWEHSGTRSQAEPARGYLRELAVDTLTKSSSSTALSEVTGVAHGRWEAMSVHTRLQRERTGETGLLWLVWSQGGHQVEADPVTVAGTSNQGKQDVAKSVLRQWLQAPDNERTQQNEKLAVLIDELNAERGAGREVFR